MTDELKELNERLKKCQMTVSCSDGCGDTSYGKCNRPVKYRVPYVAMNVEYVCGIHARSLDKLYKRTGQNIQCIPLSSSR